MEILPTDIIDVVKTSQDRVEFLSQLDVLSRVFYSHKKDITSALETEVSFKTREKLVWLARKNNISLDTVDIFNSFLETVKQTVVQIPEITLILAFAPTEQMISVISFWFTTSAKKAVVLDISVDKTLIGGTIIGLNGMYKDFSLKRKLQDKFEKGEILN